MTKPSIITFISFTFKLPTLSSLQLDFVNRWKKTHSSPLPRWSRLRISNLSFVTNFAKRRENLELPHSPALPYKKQTLNFHHWLRYVNNKTLILTSPFQELGLATRELRLNCDLVKVPLIVPTIYLLTLQEADPDLERALAASLQTFKLEQARRNAAHQRQVFWPGQL